MYQERKRVHQSFALSLRDLFHRELQLETIKSNQMFYLFEIDRICNDTFEFNNQLRAMLFIQAFRDQSKKFRKQANQIK